MAVTTNILAKMQYFTDLSSDELEAIKKYIAFEKRIEKGQTLLLEGDRSD